MLIPKHLRPHLLLDTDPESPPALTHALVRSDSLLTASDGLAMIVVPIQGDCEDAPCLVHRDVLEAARSAIPKDDSEYEVQRTLRVSSEGNGAVLPWHEALQDGGVIVSCPVGKLREGKPSPLPQKLSESDAASDVYVDASVLATLAKALGVSTVTLRIPKEGNVATVFPGSDLESPSYGFLVMKPKQLQLGVNMETGEVVKS